MIFSKIKNFILKWYHDRYKKHFLTGWVLSHVDVTQYPCCKICGARPKEGFQMKWYNQKALDLREKFGREKWDKLSPATLHHIFYD